MVRLRNQNDHFAPVIGRSSKRKKGPVDTSTPISRLPATSAKISRTAKVSPALSEISPVSSAPESRKAARLALKENHKKLKSLMVGVDHVRPMPNKSIFQKDFFEDRPRLLSFFHVLVASVYAFIIFKTVTYFDIDIYIANLWKGFH
ncbi:unnamed protein product [Enterobius vermicularis]|uniref:Transmembrane protein n=1 Tax=Enterobius vermicularis TaxID=51028 RepID=A0A0N4UZ64_ENTVE|nr:unnamed protein product [Enterobius vermicularis]